jgi:nitrite reductase (NO-forming)
VRLTARRRILPIAVAITAAIGGAAPSHAAVTSVTLTARHEVRPLLPGVKAEMWTFNRRVPGPVVRVPLGNELRITLRNADPHHRHSLDFHASEVNPMRVMADVKPGQTKTFSFTPKRAGVFMYHCGTPSVLRHVGMGMYGMIIVDPPERRSPAREIMLVQSEFYGAVRKGVLRPTVKSMLGRAPTFTAFNGSPFRYVRKPIKVRVGELVRIYLVDAGPSLGSAFHVVGEIFDTVLPDGGTAPYGSSVSTGYVPAGGAAIFELRFDEAGTYPFLTHELGVASLGAVGQIVAEAGPPA